MVLQFFRCRKIFATKKATNFWGDLMVVFEAFGRFTFNSKRRILVVNLFQTARRHPSIVDHSKMSL